MLDIEELNKGDIIVWVDNTQSIYEDMAVERLMLCDLEIFNDIKKIKRGNKTIYKRKSNKEVNT